MRVLHLAAIGLASLVPSLDQATADSVGSALRFTEDAQQAVVPNSEALNITESVTIEVWIRAEAGIGEKGIDFILSKNVSGTGYALLTNLFAENNHFTVEVGRALVYPIPLSEIQDQWVHVAGMRTDEQMMIYLNGELVAEMTTDLPFLPNERNFGSDHRGQGRAGRIGHGMLT